MDQLLGAFTFAKHDEIRERLNSANDAIRLDVVIQLPEELDVEAQLMFWPDERSYTRQSAAEIHCLGSPPLLQMLLSNLITAGCRHAQPGEFTMRAFLAGRLDLAQAEAVMGLIDAKNRQQFDAAFAQLAGGIGGPVMEARALLVNLLAELEAGLDFVEEDIEFISNEQLTNHLKAASEKVDSLLNQITKRHRDSDTVSIVLMGRPNVGKSSLFNKLTAGNAIVSDESGTTRDYIKSTIEIDGHTVDLYDTAGLDSVEAITPINKMMTGQTGAAIEIADLKILCIESGCDPDQWEQSTIDSADDSLIVAWTKCDLDYDPTIDPASGIQTSSMRAMGLPELREAIAARIASMNVDANQTSATLARTADSLTQAAKSLQIAQSGAAATSGEELVAAEVRNALDHLGRVVGKIYTDDILDQVFSRFCIGK